MVAVHATFNMRHVYFRDINHQQDFTVYPGVPELIQAGIGYPGEAQAGQKGGQRDTGRDHPTRR